MHRIFHMSTNVAIETDPAEKIGEVLHRAVVKSDQGAAEELWQLMYLAILKYAKVIAHEFRLDPVRLDDIIQNCAVQQYSVLRRDPERLLAVVNWKAWLRISLINLAKSQYRSQNRRRGKDKPSPGNEKNTVVSDDEQSHEKLRNTWIRREFSFDQPIGNEEEGVTLLDLFIQNEEDPLNVMYRRDMLGKIKAQIEAIADPIKKRVFLLYYQGDSYQEISLATDLPEITITNWIYRIKKRIVSALGGL